MQIAELVSRAVKPGLILAPHWKAAARQLDFSDDDLFRKVAELTGRPLAVAFVSHNIYLGDREPLPVTRLVSALMFHGEVGLDKVVGLAQVEEPVIDLLSRKVKFLLPEGVEVVGSPTSNLLMHAKKRMQLLNLPISNLADHAWIACAFSYHRQAGSVSGGAAARTGDGQVFRGGAIADLVTPREAVSHGMKVNGRRPDEIKEWFDCSPEEFREHRWFPNFS